MKCPNCNDDMEVEHTVMAEGSTLAEYRRSGKWTKLIPAAHYYCAGCDSEWTWTKGVKGIFQIDGADYDYYKTNVRHFRG